MNNLAREIAAVLKGPPPITQSDMAKSSHITKSKLSRLISGQIVADRDTLDSLLRGAPSDEARRRLVSAYISDCASLDALHHLAKAGNPWGGLKLSPMSKRTESALRFLMERQSSSAERIIQDLAAALGWQQ